MVSICNAGLQDSKMRIPQCVTPPVQQRIIRGRGEENNTRTVIYKMATL